MNNVNMAGMNAMGGPVGGGMPMMNNGAAGGGPRQAMANNNDNRSQLNTYIYEYFLKMGMFDCARSLLNSDQPINVMKDSPGRDNMGNGVNDEGGDDSKDDIDSKRPSDLHLPNVPGDCPQSCFLYEWWCLFWDMFNAQRGKGDGRNVLNYVTHTQQQSRMKQEQQQQMLRQMNSNAGQFRMGPGGMHMNNELARKAMQNSGARPTPQQIQMMQHAQKQQAMQREPSDGNHQQRPQSPGSADNAPSPKRPRIDGAPFNQQGGMMQNGGRGQSAGVPAQQFPGFQNANPANKNLQAYQAGLSQHQQSQMPAKAISAGGPQNQGSPMMPQGADGSTIAYNYNADGMGPNGMRGGPGGQAGGPSGNHALQDYQMQLMLLEQQNKKRLMMARQEQDSMQPRPDGQGGPGGPGMGPNGQTFQGTSPQGPRSVNSPNPSEQMKRTPHMNNAGIPSPVPEGQNRSSPGAMNFGNMGQGGHMDAGMNPQFYKMDGMNGNMMANGMRPPSSHPGGFNPQGMTPQQQQMMMARQQQQQAGWQPGPNGAPMVANPSQGAPQQAMGTPQQRNMPPPAAPAANANANGRTQPPSPQGGAAPPTPQQTNKGNPKKKNNDAKETKAKRATKKGSAANLNAGATPSADPAQEAATPTPATPITPVHQNSFKNGPNGAVQPVTNGQPMATAANASVSSAQPDPMVTFAMNDTPQYDGFEFNNPNSGMDVLTDFDFDSFLNDTNNGDENNFNFDPAFLQDNEIPEAV